MKYGTREYQEAEQLYLKRTPYGTEYSFYKINEYNENMGKENWYRPYENRKNPRKKPDWLS